ncbi:MAG: ATPase domain-containing protein [Candidatus Aenigmarchaeota archaeon]|nr:ATPase domain-containing protein [Candidatus Aenigmarchaeota archaeon]
MFCCQFLWHGLLKGERGVYISLEEAVDDIKAEALQFGMNFDKYIFGMNFDKYIKEKKCVIEYIFPKTFSDLDYQIFTKIKEVNASRLVLDSISLLGFYMEPEAKLRDKVFTLFQRLKKHGVTALIVSEIPEDSKALSRFGFEEFVADSVIILHYLEYAAGGMPRSLITRKMRRTDHGTDIYPFEITDKGIVVKKG